MYKFAQLLLIGFIAALIFDKAIATYIAGGVAFAIILSILFVILVLFGLSIMFSEIGDFVSGIFGNDDDNDNDGGDGGVFDFFSEDGGVDD